MRTRSLVEETSRVFRARVVNPKWLAAMRRHGYKGAFELAATVDYLFGYDATTGVVADWMYEKLAQTYVLDPENREFLEKSNPWALHGSAGCGSAHIFRSTASSSRSAMPWSAQGFDVSMNARFSGSST